jgi:hypothetical protein
MIRRQARELRTTIEQRVGTKLATPDTIEG